MAGEIVANDDNPFGTLNDILDLWEQPDTQRFLQRLRDMLTQPGKILVLGSTGSGKTNLLRSLHASAGLVDAIPSSQRTQTTEEHRVNIGKSPFTVLDTPGQAHHDTQRLSAIRQAMATPPIRVINVVSYGYHEYSTATDALDDYGYVNESFLERHRENEMAACLEWLSLISDPSQTAWILTVVAKADLWWDRHADVINHYQDGLYGQQIKSQDRNLKHIVLPYCSVVHRFYNTAPVSGFFDDAARSQVNLDLLRQLASLAQAS